jgi:hypothetical protein
MRYKYEAAWRIQDAVSGRDTMPLAMPGLPLPR